MSEVVDNLLNSFSDNKSGYSSKRLSAFMLMICVVVAHVKWIALADFSQLIAVLGVDYAFVAALFGLSAYQKIKENPTTTVQTIEKKVDGDNVKTTLTNEQG